MRLNLARVRTLLMDVPKQAKLAYCLLRDDRVPAAPKALLVGSLGAILSPVDVPAWIPVLGELDMLALGVLAVKVFVEACPDRLVKEHEAALRRGDSLFDQDFRGFAAAGREILASGLAALQRVSDSGAGRLPPHVLEDESA